MKKSVLLIGVLVISFSAFAQYNRANHQPAPSSNSVFDKLYFAGGGGFGSGTGPNGRYTYYSLLPTIGYRATPDLLVGTNISYSKYSYPDAGVSYDQVGYAPFVRYYFQQLFFQVEYDKISSTTFDGQPRKYYDRFFVGLGYKMLIGKRSAINAMGLYDLLYKNDGIFPSPFVFRVFFSF
jgi:hypothetical protein